MSGPGRSAPSLERVERRRAQVFLVDDAVMADHERLHAARAVLGGGRDEREAANHQAVDDEIHFAEWRRRSLALQDLEEVAMVGLRLVGVALRDRLGDLVADWTLPRAVLVPPGQAVLRARCADDSLR